MAHSMFTVTAGMQSLLLALKNRAPRMQRSAYLLSVKFSPVVDNKFTVTGYWAGKKPGSHAKTYRPEDVFMRNALGDYRYTMSPCMFANQFIREVLTARGIP